MPKILIVDDEQTNRKIVRIALEEIYEVQEAANGKEALEFLHADPPDLILLDLNMPVMDGYQFLRRLSQEDEALRTIPVIVITAFGERDSRLQALRMGAHDFLTKPVEIHELRLRVHNQIELKRYRDHLEDLVRERTRELREANLHLRKTQLLVLEKLGRAAELRDDETGKHIQRMARYARALAETLELANGQCDMILLAAPMHDIGKIGIPDGVLLKPGRLMAGEYEIMKRHTTIGATILSGSDNPLLELGRVLALYHHERWDGAGYPYGLKGDEIPLEARIIACADVFDALTSDRVYRPAWPLKKAIEYVLNEAGKHFDPTVAAAFEATLDQILEIREQYRETPEDRPHLLKIYEEYLQMTTTASASESTDRQPDLGS